jgi:hypothetical protein
VREEPGGFCIGGEFPEGKVLAISSAGTAGLKKIVRVFSPSGFSSSGFRAPPAFAKTRQQRPCGSSEPPPDHQEDAEHTRQGEHHRQYRHEREGHPLITFFLWRNVPYLSSPRRAGASYIA